MFFVFNEQVASEAQLRKLLAETHELEPMFEAEEVHSLVDVDIS